MLDKRSLRKKYSRILKGEIPANTQNQEPLEHGDEPMCNHSNNPTFASILGSRLQRRQVLRGGLAFAVTTMFAGPISKGLRPAPAAADTTLLGFTSVPVSEADTIVVPEGYTARTLIPWGEPITGSYPEYSLSNTGEEQAMQIGSHHDGMHFFPIEGESAYEGSSDEGLLVLNHEYVEPRYMHQSAIGMAFGSGDVPMLGDLRAADEVLKEMNAHGVSIVHLQKQDSGEWSVVRSDLNHRVTALTPARITGPASGSDLLKTKYSPDGTRTRGTLNNCAHGVTPWNTYMAAEENWARYFRNSDTVPGNQGPESSLPREHARYGVSTGDARYKWDLADNGADEFVRFDASTKGASATDDYRNEPNTFGWMTEIDPFDPTSTPRKHTALGRFAHEGVVFQPAIEGEPVICYSGDDARFEYIYKFVSAQPYEAATASGDLLDEGTLYVAKFHADGTGEWVALAFGENGLTPENGFADQADILVNTRTAADFVGATKMDRPEWGAVDPNTREVYFTLTNNTRRTAEQVDEANPRPESRWGHIIRWSEAGNGTFEWDLFVLAGPSADSVSPTGDAFTEDNKFVCPDGLWVDADSRVWIQTDISESVQNSDEFAEFGNNQMVVADPRTGEIRRFLTGPTGQEITGVITTPDQRTMFINVQHPGATVEDADFAAGNLNSRWPNQSPSIYPRSATVVITKDDGGVIGT
ncbi:MAG: PhoX family phosphatase [Cyanobacteria bacterium J06638_20]